MLRRCLIILLITVAVLPSLQGQPKVVVQKITPITFVVNDTFHLVGKITFDQNRKAWFISTISRFVHKGDTLISIFPITAIASAYGNDTSKQALLVSKSKVPFIKLHGNVLYELNYRSSIDTPFVEKDIYQHTVQTYIEATIKDKYPMRFYLTTRFSNSRIFKDFNDMNLEFNSNEFAYKIKERLKTAIASMPKLDSLNRLKWGLDDAIEKLLGVQSWIKNPAHIQKLVEERELLMRQRANVKTSQLDTKVLSSNAMGLTDSISVVKGSFELEYTKMKNAADSLQSEIFKLKKLYSAEKERLNTGSAFLLADIDNIKDIKGLQSRLSQSGLSDSLLPAGYKFLWGLRSLKVGRSLVDYSELSAKNISISGIQIEYNPGKYYAFATGIVHYRFRDFIVANKIAPTQYLNLFRLGKGFKDGNNIIVTYYNGRRQLFNSSTSFQGAQLPNYKIFGFTVEGRLQLNKHSSLIAELAKSSVPYYSQQNKEETVFSTLWKLQDRSNEAYSFKIASFIPSTKTKINAYYKHFGSNFQSFSLFTSGSSQSSWSAKLEQPLFKKQIFITGSIRANDFSNPFIDRAYSSKTIFKSVQASLKLRKFPIISAGYFPSSQITKLSDIQFVENLFYTLTASASHSYMIKDLQCYTSIVYTQFYNKASDSGFIYFNSKNFFMSHGFMIGKFSVQSNVALATNKEYSLYTVEPNLQYSISQWFKVGAGIKYNRQTVYNNELLGYSANASLKIKRLGEFQLSMDKGFLPGNNKQLVENNFGRLTYFKTF